MLLIVLSFNAITRDKIASCTIIKDVQFSEHGAQRNPLSLALCIVAGGEGQYSQHETLLPKLV